MDRSSRPEVFCRIVKNFPKFLRKHFCRSLFFNKVAGLLLGFCLEAIPRNETSRSSNLAENRTRKSSFLMKLHLVILKVEPVTDVFVKKILL